jgi:acyl-CoA thioester hydrolase
MQKVVVDWRVYTCDIDYAGHVNNAIYIQWVEKGRCEFLERVNFPIEFAVQSGFVPILAHTSISYKKPAKLGDLVSLELWLSELNKISHVLEFKFVDRDRKLLAEGHQKGAFLDPITQRPKQLSTEIRELFLPYLATES